MQTVTETGRKVCAIGIHRRPHFDEIIAIFILRLYGEEKYPGISEAKIKVFAGEEDLEGKTSDQWLAEGVLLVGFGGGSLDEHPNADGGAKENECAATLVAKDLGVEKEEELRLILEDALIFDSQNLEIAGEGEFLPESKRKLKAIRDWSLPTLVKLMNGMFPEEPDRVIGAIMPFVEAKYAAQAEFVAAKKLIAERKGQIREIKAGDKKLLIYSIESDNESVQKAARNRFGGSLAVVVQRGSKGHIQIFGNVKVTGPIDDIARAVRREVQKHTTKNAELNLGSLDNWKGFWKNLSQKGKKVDGADQLYYMPEGGFLLNGSLSHSKTLPIPMTLEEVVDVVQAVLDEAIFPKAFRSECQ
ncbi:MAG: hypothetical protein RJA61_268, partial [Candidatus Parcubacteria bacterium]